ncbi:hypothetical protein BHYA_0314g00010 [Botrytis hyacinthi]|uniref:DEAD/DEAH box helicase domain-containing protein n=1 Tax=Botrytis hyacinthi TaxID=278943 RepID=A0A4Z1GAJ0_9HELO|nr:hypothetical protein BHYA_0314g00010 [Botrytis hyacinthi]
MDSAKEPGDAARSGSRVKDSVKIGGEGRDLKSQSSMHITTGVDCRSMEHCHSELFPVMSEKYIPPGPIWKKNLGIFCASTQRGTTRTHQQEDIDEKKINDPPSAVLKPTVLIRLEQDLATLVLDEANVLVGNEADWSELTSPTVLVGLPTNALATQAKAAFDGLLTILNGRINKTWPSEVGSGDFILECHGAYGEIPWIEQQNARVSEYPHILVATIGSLLHMMRVKMVAFDNLGWYGVKNILVFLDTREETECLFSA